MGLSRLFSLRFQPTPPGGYLKAAILQPQALSLAQIADSSLPYQRRLVFQIFAESAIGAQKKEAG
jgi:hypothetical protein